MGQKGGLAHLKRLSAPWFWPIHRKEYAWAPKPNPGPHRSGLCIPLEVVLRDDQKLAANRREVGAILAGGKVKVDGRVRGDENYSVGIMDVVEFTDANTSYRILPAVGKGLTLVRIPKDEAKFKLCKVLHKSNIAKGRVQYGLHDGRTISTEPSGPEAAAYSTNDTLKLAVPTQKVLGQIKFERGNFAVVVAGRNIGKSGKIVEIHNGTATRAATVTIEDSTGSKFDTMADYTFVVGTDKPSIKLEA